MATTLQRTQVPRPVRRGQPRRRAARVLLVVGVLSASLCWLEWMSLHSILDVSRSDAIGRALVDDATVRAEVTRQVRDGMASSGAMSLGFTAEDLDKAAAQVAASPSVAPRIAERVAAAHQRALEPPSEVMDLIGAPDDTDFVDESILALQARRPDITIPNLQWIFTSTVDGGFPDLEGPASTAHTLLAPALIVAVASIVASAVLHPDRTPRTWVARWCMVVGTVGLVAPFTLPGFTSALGRDASSTVKAVAAAMRGGAPLRASLVLLLCGGLLSIGTWGRRDADTHPPTPSTPPGLTVGPVPLAGRSARAIAGGDLNGRRSA